MPATITQPEASRAPTSHSGRRPPTSDAIERDGPDDRHEEDERHACVGCERECARCDPAVDRVARFAGAADDLLGPVVEPRGGSADAADHLLGEPGRLPGNRVPELGARGDVAQSALRLVACEHSVGELERPRASEGRRHEALELTACGELGDDALEHPVTGERARKLLGQRAGERPVEDAGDLRRRQDLVHRLLDRCPPGARDCPCREECGAPGHVCQPGALLAVLRCHHRQYRWPRPHSPPPC